MIGMNKRVIAIGLAGAVTLSALSPSLAAPVMTNTAAVTVAQPGAVIDVRWRGRRGWAAAGIGFAAGALLGSAIASSRAYPYYYDAPAYYAPAPVYVEPAPVYVEPGPVYAAPPPVDPNGPGRRCWVSSDKDRGYGYWRPC